MLWTRIFVECTHLNGIWTSPDLIARLNNGNSYLLVEIQVSSTTAEWLYIYAIALFKTHSEKWTEWNVFCARRLATNAKLRTFCKYIFTLCLHSSIYSTYIISCKIGLCIAFSIKTILPFIYSALLQMMQSILRERTLHCKCKLLHARKFASVLADIQEVNYMLYWVVSIFYIY